MADPQVTPEPLTADEEAEWRRWSMLPRGRAARWLPADVDRLFATLDAERESRDGLHALGYREGYRAAERARPPQAEGLRAADALFRAPKRYAAGQVTMNADTFDDALEHLLRAEATRDEGLDALDGAMVEAAMRGGYVAELPADLIAERLRAALRAEATRDERPDAIGCAGPTRACPWLDRRGAQLPRRPEGGLEGRPRLHEAERGMTYYQNVDIAFSPDVPWPMCATPDPVL